MRKPVVGWAAPTDLVLILKKCFGLRHRSSVFISGGVVFDKDESQFGGFRASTRPTMGSRFGGAVVWAGESRNYLRVSRALPGHQSHFSLCVFVSP
jgi:hypothetical protein